MYHPNAELSKCTNNTQELKLWDQRIPNEPLFQRNFLLERPPVINRVPPITTTQCIAPPSSFLVVDPKMEYQSADYWNKHLSQIRVEGLPTNPSLPKKQKRKEELSKYKQTNPEQPWLFGTNININAESKLKGLDYYNPKDCINSETFQKLYKGNAKSHVAMYHQYHVISNNYPNDTPLWMNNPTKMINQEPINFDYTKFCSKQRQK